MNITFQDICELMADTYEKKNADYGNSFEQTLDEFGEIAGVIRITDKTNRLKNLIKTNNPQVEESIDDTLLDLASYAIMLYMFRNK